MNRKLGYLWILAIVLIFMISGCSNSAPEKDVLILATTTSTYDSGLLDYLLPDFESRYNAEVQVISVGTGQAIKNGESGDVDIILVHAPSSELKFVEDGFGIDRRCVMYNDFVILGPVDDPVGIQGEAVGDAFKMVSEKGAAFISRGDDSGTHKKELAIWASAGVTPEGDWYKDVGSGMGDALRIAEELQGYILADRGTYLSMKDELSLVVLVEGDDILLNPYGVIAVNPDIHKNINHDLAVKFTEWIMSGHTQQMIGDFKKNGEQLFTPLGGECIGG